MILKPVLALLLVSVGACGGAGWSMIDSSVQPNGCLDGHAANIKKFADGFFFVAGDWSDASTRLASANNKWLDDLRKKSPRFVRPA